MSLDKFARVWVSLIEIGCVRVSLVDCGCAWVLDEFE